MKKILLMGSLVGLAYSQTGLEIATMLDEKKQPKDMVSKTFMVLTNAKGKTRTNTMLSKSLDGGEKQIIWFLAPADDKGVAFLKIEHAGKDDEMRMWLPAFKKIRRISSKKKGDSFMGSDLSYEDMTNRDLCENDYQRLEDETVDGKECYVLEVTPKPVAKSSYTRHVTWVVKENLTPLKEESYDKRGNLKKVKSFNFFKTKGYDVIREIFVEDVQKKHTTKVSFEDVDVDTGVPATLFQEKNLKRIPKN